ncbi:MAG: hypothetical protein KJZ65_04930 [Phycisphaerales bacterium]|nr:hypothetical protein [Phycisphaerales bacterium]
MKADLEQCVDDAFDADDAIAERDDAHAAAEDPAALGVRPFRTAFNGHRFESPSPAWAGIEGLSPDVHLLPGASAYVGVDNVAGVDAVNLPLSPGPVLFLDSAPIGKWCSVTGAG